MDASARHESGVAVPTYAVIKGDYALRVAHTNHRSQPSDFDLLVAEVKRIGAELVGTGPQASTAWSIPLTRGTMAAENQACDIAGTTGKHYSY